MTFPAHLASGYLIYRAAASFGAEKNPELLVLALLGSLAPDIDALFFGKRINNHRNTIFHTPFFWAFICLATLLFFEILYPNLIVYPLVFFSGSLLHVFLDWASARTGGVRLLYPFSKKECSLFPLSPQHGDIPVLPNKEYKHEYKHVWKFYFRNTLLLILEFSIILAASLLLLID